MAKHNVAFIISTVSSVIAALFLLIGASIWTVVIHRSRVINNVLLKLPSSQTQVAIGIAVSSGSGLYLVWAAFVLMLFSVIPYMIRYVSRLTYPTSNLTCLLAVALFVDESGTSI